jgi:hypothetical protein
MFPAQIRDINSYELEREKLLTAFINFVHEKIVGIPSGPSGSGDIYILYDDVISSKSWSKSFVTERVYIHIWYLGKDLTIGALASAI